MLTSVAAAVTQGLQSFTAETVCCRPRQPWEASDGAVLLVRELAAVAPGAVPQFLPAVAELASLDGFAHCCHLQANQRS